MQLNQVKRDIVSSGTMEVSKAKIKATAKLFDMFADQTYANKPVAILRELVANGVDAHIAAGKPDVPVEIYMPSVFDPMFKVKDFGVGMHHDFVMGPFMEYTNGSTKDSDNTQIGGFGIGSKSPFAYCDQFTLRVVHDGVLSVYTMFKGEDGIPAIGLQGQTTTDEANGVEVSFPIENDDIESFVKAAQDALQYFQPLPVVHGGSLEAPNYTHVASNKTWAMKASPDGTLGVIMGGVRYPVTESAVEYSLRQDPKLGPLLNYGIDLFVPIGTADVAMSREALSYTPRTHAALRQALTSIVDDVAATFATLFDKHKTEWDAKKALYDQLIQMNGGSNNFYRGNPRAKMLQAFAQWKGKPLTLDVKLNVPNRWDGVTRAYKRDFPKNYPEGAEIWVPQFTSWRTTFPPAKFVKMFDASDFSAGAYVQVFVDDMPVKTTSRPAARVKEYMEGKGWWVSGGSSKPVLVFRAEKSEDKASIKAMLDYLGNPSSVVYLSTLPEPKRVVSVKTSSGAVVVRPKVRMFTFTGNKDRFGTTIVNLSPAHAKRDEVKEIAEKDQPASGIMYAMENFNLPADFRNKMKLGVVKWDELVFVNQSDAKHLKATFETFDDVFKKRYPAFKKQHMKDLAEKKWFADKYDGVFEDIVDVIQPMIENGEKLPKGLSNTPFGKMFLAYEKYGSGLTDVQKALAAHENVTPAPIKGLENIEEEFEKRHPHAFTLLKLIYSSQWNREDVRALFIHSL